MAAPSVVASLCRSLRRTQLLRPSPFVSRTPSLVHHFLFGPPTSGVGVSDSAECLLLPSSITGGRRGASWCAFYGREEEEECRPRPRPPFGQKGWSSQATSSSSGQRVLYSSAAVKIEDDATVQLASEIGYEVLGQYTPEGHRITPQAAFAVLQVGSHQFKVSPGDMIYTEKLKYADINEKLFLNKVLLMGSRKETVIGRPFIPEAGVLAVVEEHALDEKVIVFKKKRRKNYRRTKGHRQELTRLRILQIDGIDTTDLAQAQDRKVREVES